ncbi:TolC family protein [Halomonadaceae bacterium KBTZ08]
MQNPKRVCGGGVCSCAVLAVALALGVSASAVADTWTLQQSIEQARSVSPEIERRRAAVRREKGRYAESGGLPNPSFSLTAGDVLGRKLQTDDVRVQRMSLTQRIPVGGRSAADAEAAGDALSAARASAQAASLSVAHRTARLFQRLRHARARVRIAERRKGQAQRFERIAQQRAGNGDIAPREAQRLGVLAARAEAALADARRHQADIVQQFRSQLALEAPVDPVPSGSGVDASRPPSLAGLRERLEGHPALVAARHRTDSARSRVHEADASRIPDLELSLNRERLAVQGSAETGYTVGLGVEVPLWTTYGGRAEAARGKADEARQALRERRRQLERRLSSRHDSLTRLVERLRRHRERILAPSRQVLEQTDKGYRAGSVGLAELIDATGAVWEAERTREDLLLEARIAQFELKEAAGLAPGEAMQ